MKLAVLFWFYKDVDVCINRLKLLRKNNKQIQIFGLYGGDLSNKDEFKYALTPYLNDFYSFEGIQDSAWKWRNGDLMIATWYKERGKQFEWDTISVVQADMLVLDNVSTIFAGLQKDEILLSSTRPVGEVIEWWYWISEHKQLYSDFHQYLVENYNYSYDPVCCQFVVVCFPKIFLEKFSEIKDPEKGFIEYRVPMYAQLFEIQFSEIKSFECWWSDDPSTNQVSTYSKTLIADKIRIPLGAVWLNSIKNKKKIFHPFDDVFPFTISSCIQFLKQAYIEKFMKRVAALVDRVPSLSKGNS